MSFLVLFLIASVIAAESDVKIVTFNPVNGTLMSSVSFPVEFTFSDSVRLGNGCVVFENDFGDLTKACGVDSITVADKNATVQLKDKFYYGSSYRVYFEDGPFVDANNATVALNKGEYVFSINKKNNTPMFIGIGLGMAVMLVLIFVAYFILKCLVKRKEAKEAAAAQLPQTVQDTQNIHLRNELEKFSTPFSVITIACFQVADEVEQTIEVTVDNDISIPEEINTAIEEKEVKEIIDCDVFARNGTCIENFDDLEKLNEINNLFKYFDSFINCDSVSCIQQQKELLQERLELGDPVAQYTYSVFKKYGLYSYGRDQVESFLYLESAVDGGNVLAMLVKAVQYQINDQRELNGTLLLETILPAWKLVSKRNLSLFSAIYEKGGVEWPADVASIRYDIADYVDVLKAQLSEKDFKKTKRKVLMAEKETKMKELIELYDNDPAEQHFIGFMYLEGIGCERDYAKAWQYFDNNTNPLYNTTYHVFGRGIIHYYGLGVEKNVSRGCDYFSEASLLGSAPAAVEYYLGLCALKNRDFKRAKEKMTGAAFTQFTPAIDVLLRMKDSRLGSKMMIDYSMYFASILMSRVKETFIRIPTLIREGYNKKDTDKAIVYSLIGFDTNIPYWGSHVINVFEKMIWKGLPCRFAYGSIEGANSVYRLFMEYLLSISPANEHAVDVALASIEGIHGYPQNIELGKKILEASKTNDARFYLGVIHQDPKVGLYNQEMAKMNFDAAIESDTYSYASMFYRFKLIGTCLWEKVKNREWREALTMLEKVIILNQKDIVYDDNCNIITDVRNNVNAKTIVEYAERLIDSLDGGEELKNEIKEIKEKLKEKRKKAMKLNEEE